jgi:hypothetical protein
VYQCLGSDVQVAHDGLQIRTSVTNFHNIIFPIQSFLWLRSRNHKKLTVNQFLKVVTKFRDVLEVI